jgi:ABC-type antimicrobial peptide transport system permease subunit
MIKNYLKTAYRILFRNKVFSLINIFGLSLALTSVLVIFLFISHELSFDKYQSNFKNIYRVVNTQIKNGKESVAENVPVPLGTALKTNLTGYENVTQLYFSPEQLIRIEEDRFEETGFLFIDTCFNKVFDVDFIIGDPQDLANPNVLFLTEDFAVKYFGSIKNAVNKEIVLLDSISFNVAGIVKNPVKETHLPYNVLLSWSSINQDYFTFEYNEWGTRISGFSTYLTLQEGISVERIEGLIHEIDKENNTNWEEDSPERETYLLQPLKQIHFDERFGSFAGTYVTGKPFIWAFSSVALFILIIAFINFTNLSVVQTIKRAKEVGIRKVLGADRILLIKQFLGETFLLLLIAEIISLILTEIVLDKINNILGNSIELELYGNFSIILFLLLILVSLTFLSGIYPATVLSKYNPIRALRYNMKLGKKKVFSMHNLLVVFQFLISQILIVSAVVITLQINYINNKDLGFKKDQVIMVKLPDGHVDKSNIFKDLIAQNPKIEHVSIGIGAPMSGSNITSSFQLIGDLETNFYANVKTVDNHYKDLYEFKMLAGEWYKDLSVNDSTFNIVVNNTLLKQIGITNPNEAIDQYLKVFGSINARIVGVIDDFHLYTFHRKMSPVIFLPLDIYFSKMHISTNEENLTTLIPFVESTWDEIFPDYIFNYEVLTDVITSRYKSEKRMSQLIKIFTFIAILIACMGLFGLVSFMMVQRTKEIGIRKALGASIFTLIKLVSKKFLYLVIVSCLFAWPIAYYIMTRWLENYAYKIDLNIWVFVLSGAILLIITFITILYQSVKVALTNPVDVLKYE